MRRGHKKGNIKHLARKLDLNDTQKESVREISKTARQDIRTIVRDDFGGDRKSAKEAVSERREKMVADIKAQLTPEQVEKFDELKQDRQEGKRGKRGHGKRDQGKRGQK
jgi:Spy/CpxP family protein refolding chaperone